MTDTSALKQELEGELQRLAGRYIDQYFPADPTHTPDVFEYDVKAYAVLAHAALEEFVEAVSELTMVKLVDDIMLQKVSIATACFLMAYNRSIKLLDVEGETQASCFNMVRVALNEGKTEHSKAIKDNHGFSVKYLRSILIPVGINVPAGPEVDAVKKLADARGSFAHTAAKKAVYGDYRQATKVLTPDEAKEAVTDCLLVCEKIRAQADAILAT